MGAQDHRRRRWQHSCALAQAAVALLVAGCAEEPLPQRVNTPARPAVTLVAQMPKAGAENAGQSFAFPVDAVGAQLESALAPPRQLPLAPVPAEAAPREWIDPPAAVAAVTSDESANARSRAAFPLSMAEIPFAPQLLAADTSAPWRMHRAMDAPPLHLAAESPFPARAWLPYGALVRNSRADAESLPLLVVHPKPWEAPLSTTSDFARRESDSEIVKVMPAQAAVPAPPEESVVVDPLSQLRYARLASQPVDADPPSGGTAALPRPKLPEDAPEPANSP